MKHDSGYLGQRAAAPSRDDRARLGSREGGRPAGFGIDNDTAVEYAREAAEYERLLLAGEPLGADIEIAFEESTFVYDGAAGEGGYVDPSEPD